MKKVSLLKTMLLLFALIAGSSSAWADDVLVYTLDGTITGGTSGYDVVSSISQDEKDWDVYGNTTTNPWRIGGKSLDGVDRDIIGKTAFTDAITKITFNHGGVTSDKFTVNSVKLTVASDDEFSSVVDVVTLNPTIAKKTDGSFDFTPSSPLTAWPAGCYYKFTFNISNSADTNYAFQVKSIKFYKGMSLTPTTTTIDASGISNTNIAAGTAAGTLTASVMAGSSAVSGAEVTWASSDEAVATVGETTGVVTLVAPGTTTITASYAGDGVTYGASSDTYELTVADSRAEAGLAYEESEQTVNLGDMLAAPTLTNPHGLTVYFVSDDESIATVDASGNVQGVALGSTTITAMFDGNESYRPGSASYTIFVKKTLPAGTLFFEAMSGYSGSSDSGTALTNTSSSLDSDNWDTFTKVYPGKVISGDTNGHMKFGSSSAAGKAITGSIALTGTGMLTFKAQRYDSTHNGHLSISVSGATAVGDLDITGEAGWQEKTVYLFDATGDVVITFETTSADPRIRVDDILVVEGANVSAEIDATYEWATFCSTQDLDFTGTGVDAYIVTGFDGDAIVKTQVYKVPANTGLLLNGATDNIPLYTGEVFDDVSANKMVAVTTAETISAVSGKTRYVLADEGGKAMFLSIGATDADVPAGKAYLEIDGDGARALYLDGETTAIQSLENNKVNDGVIYDLSGRRVENPTKGIFIMNGKKVVIK